MTPRADFICLSKKCATDEGAPTYELPIHAVCCPACGSKRIKRLYNRINIATGAQPDRFDGKLTSSSHAARTDAFARPAMDEAIAKRDALRDAALAPRPFTPFQPSMVPVRSLGSVISVRSGAGDLTKKADLGGQANPYIAEHMEGRNLRQDTRIDKVDTGYKIVKGSDGGPTIEKA